MAQTQAKRSIEATSPLGADVLLFRHMEAEEELGRLFKFTVDLLSEDEQIKFEDLLGQPMTIRLDLPDAQKRYFHGFVSSFAYTGRYRGFASYKAVLRPWLWFLTRTADCRIFQNKTVPDIIKEIFREHGFTDVDDLLSGTYRTWEYCVQYRETDFNFVSRLMEQEGMYYYFTHEQEEHTIVLADSISAHHRISGYERVPYYPPSDNVVREEDHIYDWYLSQEVQPGSYVLDDFDFKRPKTDLLVKLDKPRQHARSDFEVFDYPGEYVETAEGNGYVRARFEELQSQHERVKGQGNARGLYARGLFELSKYPRQDQNREYLIVSATHHLHSPAYETGAVAEALPLYTCELEAIGSHQAYRSPRTTVKPHVQGPQTAIVVGPSGEEIHTDQYGRVKVQFHWDRTQKLNENSSCWIRVSHPWAGKGWGSVATPRIGQEVIVDFLEGDPDQPIITGRVYNGNQMPPFGFPAGAVLSGIKSNTHKGHGYNELSMDDTAGKEKITIHGQYDMNSTIEHDQTLTVHNNRTDRVDVDDAESVGNNQKCDVGVNQDTTVGSNQTLSVGANRTVTVGANQTTSIGANESISVGAAKTETIAIAKALTIGAGYQVSVGAAMNETIGGLKGEQIGGAKIVAVGGISSENVGGSKSTNSGGSISENAAANISNSAGSNVSISAGSNVGASAGADFAGSAGGKMGLSAGGDFSVSGGAKGVIDIASELILKCGGASIVLKSGGEISIKGTDVTIDGSGKITIKAGGDIVMKGSKILQN